MISIVMFVIFLAMSSQDVSEEEWSPEFGEPISNVTVPLGREAIFSCTVRNLGLYKVGWLRAEDQTVLSLDSKVVTHNFRISVTHEPDGGTWRLHIRQVKYTDRGCYMCQINTSTMKKQIGCLDVHVPPDILDTGTSSDALVEEGENVTLTCAARGHPFPRIVWRREDGKTFTVYNQSGGFATVDYYGGSKLEMVKVDYNQMGAYLCIATNDIPPAVSKRIVLRIHFAPMSRQPDQIIGAVLGSTLNLSCKFHAFPSDNSTWMKDSVEIVGPNDRYWTKVERMSYFVNMLLVMTNVTAIDFGKYHCYLSNDKGSARASIMVYEIRIETSTVKEITAHPFQTESHLNFGHSTTSPTAVLMNENNVIEELIMMNEVGIEREAEVSSRRSSTSGVKCRHFLSTIFVQLLILILTVR